MTQLDPNIEAALLCRLRQQSPSWLRNQLTEPDPVMLHDWHVTKTQYETCVRDALRLVT